MNCIVTVDELHQLLSEPDVLVIDCRFDLANTGYGYNAWRQAHVPGAFYAHLDEDLSGTVTAETGRHPLPELAAFKQKLAAWGLQNHTHVVAYDDGGGMFAARLWWLLSWLGHERVSVLNGGWSAWQGAGLAQQSEQPVSPQLTDYPEQLEPRQGWLVDAGELTLLLQQQAVSLWDAREGKRFSGEVEPIDKKAGHIPGAVNVPFVQNIDNGKFLPVEKLKGRFDSLLANADASNIVHMCGSGVTACQNLLAMKIAGYRMGRLYAGSWSEWITNDSRPVKMGK